MELENLTSCPLCYGSDFVDGWTRVQFKGSLATYSLCNTCQVAFLNPRMTDAETERYYSGPYRQVTLPDENAERHDLRAQELRAQYQHGIFALNVPDTIHGHLDIGCSAGYLLKEFDAPDTVGVEPDDRFYQQPPASSFHIVPNINQVTGTFDLVTMSHVLEHANHPHEFLDQILPHAEKYVLIEVPNAPANLHAYLIHHPVAYGARALSNLMDLHGFETKLTAYHGLGSPLSLFLLGIFQRKAK